MNPHTSFTTYRAQRCQIHTPAIGSQKCLHSARFTFNIATLQHLLSISICYPRKLICSSEETLRQATTKFIDKYRSGNLNCGTVRAERNKKTCSLFGPVISSENTEKVVWTNNLP